MNAGTEPSIVTRFICDNEDGKNGPRAYRFLQIGLPIEFNIAAVKQHGLFVSEDDFLIYF